MEQTTLGALSAKLDALLTTQNAEVERLNKLAPVISSVNIPQPKEKDGEFLVSKKVWEIMQTKDKIKFLKMNVSIPGINVQLLAAEGMVAAAKNKPKVLPAEYEALESIKKDIKTVLGQINDLTKTKVKTSGGNGTRAAPSANGKNAKPEGYYKVTDQIRKAMNVRNETKVGNDTIATYTVNGVDRRSKIVNAAIAYHKLAAKTT
jgi:hypothetical protein